MHRSTIPSPGRRRITRFAIYRTSRSEVLLRLIQALWVQYGAYLNLIISQEEALRVDEHVFHHKIVAALRKGDRAEAQAALLGDIERSFRNLMPDN